MKKLRVVLSVVVALVLMFAFVPSVQAVGLTEDVKFEVLGEVGTTGSSTIDLGTIGFAAIPGWLQGKARIRDWTTYTKFNSNFTFEKMTYTPPTSGACTLAESGFGYGNLWMKCGANVNLVKGTFKKVNWKNWVQGVGDYTPQVRIYENTNWPNYGLHSVDVRYDAEVKAYIDTKVAPGEYTVDLYHWFNVYP